MTKGFSLGDLNINQQAAECASPKKFNLGDFNKQLPPDENKIKKDKTIKNFIPIQKNADGSLKYTFDNIYDNEQLMSVAKDYYSNKNRESYTDKGCCLTEKILKPLYYKKPFISMASKGYHTFLKKQGFYLYDELFDYSFDNSSFKIRFQSLMSQMKTILKLPSKNLKNQINSVQSKLDHNHKKSEGK